MATRIPLGFYGGPKFKSAGIAVSSLAHLMVEVSRSLSLGVKRLHLSKVQCPKDPHPGFQILLSITLFCHAVVCFLCVDICSTFWSCEFKLEGLEVIIEVIIEVGSVRHAVLNLIGHQEGVLSAPYKGATTSPEDRPFADLVVTGWSGCVTLRMETQPSTQ